MPAHLPADHFCPWRDEAERLSAELDEVRRKIAALERRVFGKSSERRKVPPVDRQLRKERPVDREASKKKRADNAAQKANLPTELVEHRVPEDQRSCSACGTEALKTVGNGKESVEYEYVPAYFRRRIHRRETLACDRCNHIITAPAPVRVTDKTCYGPGFVAHLIVAKCCDSSPIHRLEKQYAREGVPIARSTMNDLLHRGAELLSPLALRVLAIIAAADVVRADETSHRLQTSEKRAYIWTFTDGELIAYRFSADRSGQTPAKVLGGTQGTLVVDAYTGYNHVTKVGGRKRAGCMAHARRKFHEALATAPEAQTALDMILAVYRVEHDALADGVVRTEEHLAMRQARTLPVLQEMKTWLEQQKPLFPPKGPMGKAISYALNNWQALTRFLDDVNIPVDNNASERALRVIALGRKNFLFFGHEQAGENIAGLYTLVASCEAVGVNPVEYLTDVLIRIQDHPADRIDELLPHRWSREADVEVPAAAA